MFRTCIAAVAAGLFVFHAPLSGQSPSAPATHQHAHAKHGPHGGELLEIGKEEYHAELVIDEVKDQLVVYLMDGHVKGFIAIEAPFLAVNLKIVGKPVQMKLLAVPQAIDKKGFSSRFSIASPELIKALHGGHADARLALRIGNRAYTVKIEHNHDHASHHHAPVKSK